MTNTRYIVECRCVTRNGVSFVNVPVEAESERGAMADAVARIRIETGRNVTHVRALSAKAVTDGV